MVGKGGLLGLLARMCSCLRNEELASLATQTNKQNKIGSLYISKMESFRREAVFSFIKVLVSWMPSSMPGDAGVSSDIHACEG